MEIAPVAGKVLSDEQRAVLMSAVNSRVDLCSAASRDSSSLGVEKKECPFSRQVLDGDALDSVPECVHRIRFIDNVDGNDLQPPWLDWEC